MHGCSVLHHFNDYGYTENTMKRTNPELEQHILTQILLGYPYSEIAQNTGVAVSTIKKIKSRNKAQYEKNEKELQQWSSEEAKASLQRTYRLLDAVLDEAERGVRELSVNEIILISNQMAIHEQISSATSSGGPLAKRQQNLDNLLSKLKKR